jgi:hypothetical protein
VTCSRPASGHTLLWYAVTMAVMRSLLSMWAGALLLVAPAYGMKETLSIEDDYRLMVAVDTFGFHKNGQISLKMSGLKVGAEPLVLARSSLSTHGVPLRHTGRGVSQGAGGGGGLQMHGVLTAARAAQVTVEDEPVQQQGNEIGMLVSNVGPDMLLALEENVRGN